MGVQDAGTSTKPSDNSLAQERWKTPKASSRGFSDDPE
jgi:hypothetical protein